MIRPIANPSPDDAHALCWASRSFCSLASARRFVCLVCVLPLVVCVCVWVSCVGVCVCVSLAVVVVVDPALVDYCTTQQPFFLFFFSSITTWLAEVGPGTTCFETWAREVTPLLLSALPAAVTAAAPPPPPPAPVELATLLPWEFVPFCAVAWFCESCKRIRKRDRLEFTFCSDFNEYISASAFCQANCSE